MDLSFCFYQAAICLCFSNKGAFWTLVWFCGKGEREEHASGSGRNLCHCATYGLALLPHRQLLVKVLCGIAHTLMFGLFSMEIKLDDL